MHKLETDYVNPKEEPYNELSRSKLSEYLIRIQYATSTTEKAVLITNFGICMMDMPRYLAIKPSIFAIIKEKIAGFQKDFKERTIPDPIVAAKFQQIMEDVEYVFKD